MGNWGKQTWKRVGGPFTLSPKPRPSPFFLAHFSLCFPNYLKACYRLSTSFISKFLWYVFNLSVEHFWRFVIDQRGNGFGSTNFSTAFRLRNCHFCSFLFSFFYFFFFSSIVFFRRIFRFSPQSLSLSPPPLPHPICSTQKGTAILFCSRPFVWLFRVLGLRKKYGLLCGLKQTRTQSLFMCFGGERRVGWGARGVSEEGTKEK